MTRVILSIFIVLNWVFGLIPVHAQECERSLTGTIVDGNGHMVPHAQIIFMGADTSYVWADSNGLFALQRVCPGHCIITCLAEGFEPAYAHVDVHQDDKVAFVLHTERTLSEVVVNGVKRSDLYTLSLAELKGAALMQSRGLSLGEALKSLPGLNSIQMGATMSKPVIHGMHSNRILIMNNGVRQEGQQWGADHAPEIDPYMSNNITVIKGAASVRYGSDAIGGVVLMEPEKLHAQQPLSGNVHTLMASNGYLGGISAQVASRLSKHLQGLVGKLQATYKRGGNYSAPTYYLNNTGIREANVAATIAYLKPMFEAEAFFSSYNSRNGIFEGAHVGNVADLYAAFNRTEPSIPGVFSYTINRSYQQLRHDLVKLSLLKKCKNELLIESKFSRQMDQRDEYDVSLPYSNNPDILARPQLSFQLITHAADVNVTLPSKKGWSSMAGLSANTQGNVFQGIRYLVPNFRNYQASGYAISRYRRKRFLWEVGARYDYKWQKVYLLNTTNLKVYEPIAIFKNPTATLGMQYQINKSLQCNVNTGSAWRAPSINELYINGVHFSEAKFQVGDSKLVSEIGWNNNMNWKYTSKWIQVYAEGYINSIHNYIYERPTLQTTTLISGTYPLFQYTQTDAIISGGEGVLDVRLSEVLSYTTKGTMVRGWNAGLQQPLVLMPADKLLQSLTLSTHTWKGFKEPYITLQHQLTAKQIRVPDQSDFVPPPNGYQLWQLNIGGSIKLRKCYLNVDLGVQNLLNTTYRDYLNQYRYYANDMGTNLILKTKLSF